MVRHKTDSPGERYGSGEFCAEIGDRAFSSVVEEPVGGVMQARKVAIYLSAPIAGFCDGGSQLGSGCSGGSGESEDGFHKRDAVEAAEENRASLLRRVLVKGCSNVGGAYEFSGEKLHSCADWLFIDTCHLCF